MKNTSIRTKSVVEVPRTKPEQIALRIGGPLRERIIAVANAMSNEAQTTSLSDVARRCLVGHLPVLERELGLAAATKPASSGESDTAHWIAEAKKRATKANAKT